LRRRGATSRETSASARDKGNVAGRLLLTRYGARCDRIAASSSSSYRLGSSPGSSPRHRCSSPPKGALLNDRRQRPGSRTHRGSEDHPLAPGAREVPRARYSSSVSAVWEYTPTHVSAHPATPPPPCDPGPEQQRNRQPNRRHVTLSDHRTRTGRAVVPCCRARPRVISGSRFAERRPLRPRPGRSVKVGATPPLVWWSCNARSALFSPSLCHRPRQVRRSRSTVHSLRGRK
jgi:hypothetical protein